jgi:putative transposase
VKELVAKIELLVQNYNKASSPFAWTATADSILQKVKRLYQSISETGREMFGRKEAAEGS